MTSNSDSSILRKGSEEHDSGDKHSLLSWSHSGYSPPSLSEHQNGPSRLGGVVPEGANNPRRGSQPQDEAALYAPSTSTASTSSTGSDVMPYTTCADSGVSCRSPRDVASRQPTGTPFEPSIDPIILRFASNYTSPARQISWFESDSTISLDTIRSGYTESKSAGSSTQEEDGADTPGTSEGDLENEDFFAFGDAAEPLRSNGVSLLGLEFPIELRRPLCPEADDDDDDDLLEETIYANPQAQSCAESWLPSSVTLASHPELGDTALAPPPGLAYDILYSPIHQYTRALDRVCNKGRATLAMCAGRAARTGFQSEYTREFKIDRHTSVAAGGSEDQINIQDIQSEVKFNTWIKLHFFQGGPIHRTIDCTWESVVQTQVSIFHPKFLVSHLSVTSVSTFSAQLWGENSSTLEYPVDFSLGFGLPICLQISAFIPKDKALLRSFQKKGGEDKLNVQDSLPIAFDCFSIESMAETIDAWLDALADSPFELLGYANFMMERHPGNLSAATLQETVFWFLGSRNKLLEPERVILRIALKLLLTTSILSLPPKVTFLPPSLAALLSPSLPDSSPPSYDAPKLLTRQIKASTYHLQVILLQAFFSGWVTSYEIAGGVRLAAALTVSFTLELTRNAGRQFAKYANAINEIVSVEMQHVEDYERNVERDVFDRLRAGLFDLSRGGDKITGELADRLRDLASTRKGKGRENEKCRFVSAILSSVL